VPDGLVHPNEVVDLIIAVLALPIFARMMSSHAGNQVSRIVGYVAVVLALVFTIVESFVAPDLFNILEHAMYAVAGSAFLVSVMKPLERAGEGRR